MPPPPFRIGIGGHRSKPQHCKCSPIPMLRGNILECYFFSLQFSTSLDNVTRKKKTKKNKKHLCGLQDPALSVVGMCVLTYGREVSPPPTITPVSWRIVLWMSPPLNPHRCGGGRPQVVSLLIGWHSICRTVACCPLLKEGVWLEQSRHGLWCWGDVSAAAWCQPLWFVGSHTIQYVPNSGNFWGAPGMHR